MKAPLSPVAILRDGAGAPPQDEGGGCGAQRRDRHAFSFSRRRFRL